MTEAMLEKQLGEPGLAKKIYNGYKKLGEINFLEIGARLVGREYKAEGRVAKMINARSIASFGLLGISFFAGAGAAVGIGAIAARRGLSGVGAAAGSYDFAMTLRNKYSNESEIQAGLAAAKTSDEISELMIKMQVRHKLDGKGMDVLKENQTYNDLSTKFLELFEAEKQAITPESLHEDQTAELAHVKERIVALEMKSTAEGTAVELSANPEYVELVGRRQELLELHAMALIEKKLAQAEEKIEAEEIKERATRLKIGAGAVVLGAVVGVGVVSRLLGHGYMSLKAAPTELPAQPVLNVLPKTETGPLATNTWINGQFENGKFVSNVAEGGAPETTPQINIPETPSDIPVGTRVGTSLETLEVPKPAAVPVEAEVEAKSVVPKPRIEAPVIAENLDLSVKPGSGQTLEGNILSLKKINPESYAKMVDALRAQDPEFKGDDGGLVHRFVSKFGESSSVDVDKISEAKITIGPDGLPKIENLKGIDVSPDSNEVSVAPRPTTPEIQTPIEFTPQQAVQDVQQPLKIETMPGAIENIETKPVVPNIAPSVEFTAPAAVEVAPPAPQSVQDTLLNAEVEKAITSAKNTSKALEVVMGETDAKKFITETYNISTKDLDKVGDLEMAEFRYQYTYGDPKFQAKYKLVYEKMEIPEWRSKKTVRQWIIEVAKKIKN